MSFPLGPFDIMVTTTKVQGVICSLMRTVCTEGGVGLTISYFLVSQNI